MTDAPNAFVLPRPTEVDLPHWDGLKRHELLLQRCTGCATFVWYPAEICPTCHELTLEWTPVEAAGSVYSFTAQYQRTGSRFDGEIPYVSAVVELRDAPGVTMGARLTGVDPESVTIGMSVIGEFVDATPEVTVLRFRPAQGAA